MNSSLPKQADKTLEAYVDWRESCLLVSDGYRTWSSATGVDVTAAFVRYMKALDREERAAEVYARLIPRVGDVPTAEHNPAGTLAALAPRAHRRSAPLPPRRRRRRRIPRPRL
jgi:hypothetical protein